MNAGGGQLTTSLGTFAADNSFAPTPGNSYTTSTAIANTSDDGLYQSERYGNPFSYAFPVTSGQQYRVVLHFAEIDKWGSGLRVFDVSAEGSKVLDNYDIFQKAGGNFKAISETFTVTAADGTLNLAFSALASEGGVDNAKVSAIEVYSVSSTTPTNPAPVANAGADKTITLPTNSVVLTGSGTDDGSIAGYSWSQVGTTPSTATLSGANTASLTASGLVAGTYTFALVVTDNLGKASAADQVVVTVNSTTTTPAGQQVTSFTLINADTDLPIRDLVAGDVLNLATLPTKNLNIRANTNPTVVGSVVFVLSGAVNLTESESDPNAPYALFPTTGYNYHPWTPPVGSYSLKGTPYTQSNGAGTAGTALTVNFTVTDQTALTASTTSTTLKEKELSFSTSLVNVYPNPSSDGHFTVELPEAFQGEITYTLVSSTGSKVSSGKAILPAATSLLQLNFADQMSIIGEYYLHLQGAKIQTHLKLIRK
ncbi:hypothetical protein H9L05_13895 [Hymenobacter qilianensis]|uniref:PKD/Chitinase domain-containing protein n=1 Tax=Hymenobacter qilianensis TaxID=1385715 RepID=A0A7H0GSB5_9BACT|nr:malectin domain-containing carbohydrate-binding protein [Hymenobacter qilianensis]QNP51181.1 hypothetical protein H9L05_13895 [Hymenobacter qilianensis]